MKCHERGNEVCSPQAKTRQMYLDLSSKAHSKLLSTRLFLSLLNGSFVRILLVAEISSNFFLTDIYLYMQELHNYSKQVQC